MANSRQATDEMIIDALRKAKGNKSQAAKLLNVSVRTMQEWTRVIPGVHEVYLEERYKLVDSCEMNYVAYASGYITEPVLDDNGEFVINPDGTMKTKRRRVRDVDQLKAMDMITRNLGRDYGWGETLELQGNPDKPVQVTNTLNVEGLSLEEKKTLLSLLKKAGAKAAE